MKKLLIILAAVSLCLCAACQKQTSVERGGDSMTITLSGGIPIELKKIPAGSFKMGSYESTGDEDEQPVRDVTLTKDFYISVYEITQAQWNAVMSRASSDKDSEQLPAESISWNDCQEFCKRLSKSSGLAVSMPTEAQWEYACRAGTETRWFFGDDESEFGKYADDGTAESIYPVGSYEPNPNGLYDMYGNVMEWCLDYYGSEYPADDITDPRGVTEGISRVTRGGGWGMSADECRSAYRNANGENDKSNGIGLRIVVNTQ